MATTLRLPHLFSPGCVLQRGGGVPVWGWAAPAAVVTVSCAGRAAEALADGDGRWRLTLPELPAGGPYELVVASGDESLAVDDVLVGEVWLASGQSNMHMAAANAGFSLEELTDLDLPRLRCFSVAVRGTGRPLDDAEGTWVAASGGAVSHISGAALACAIDLHRRLGVPVGMIQAAVGGTFAEWWTRREALDAHPDLRPLMDALRASGATSVDPTTPAAKAAAAAWQRAAFHQDPGIAPACNGWSAPGFDDAGWQDMVLPCTWESQGHQLDGACWFRRTVEIPDGWVGRDLLLSLGPVDDHDHTFVNGELVGRIGAEHPDAYCRQRRYTVPARLVAGRQITIAVRVFDHYGDGGIVAGPMFLLPLGAPIRQRLRLDGAWRFRFELPLPPKAGQPMPPPPPGADVVSAPGNLWNGMIAPLAPYALRGVVWYQGEANAVRAEQYLPLMQELIRDWRRAFARELVFVQVELALWRERRPVGDSDWAELREAQLRVADTLAGVAVVPQIDSGDAADIHPHNKALVGHRLARRILDLAYGCGDGSQPPRYAGHAIAADGSLTVRFRHCWGGLMAVGGTVRGFALAGADRRWHPAAAVLRGDSVVLRSPAVPAPVAVRYAWTDNPDCSLANQDGWPAHPFRSDDWPLTTAGKRV
jgi:sialate O-acetylesterase